MLDRRDVKAGGELETVAALLGADPLLPADDGTAPLFGLLEESVRHAVGVSKDLREGVRQSIELLAGEVLARRRERDLPSDVDGLAADGCVATGHQERRFAAHSLSIGSERGGLNYEAEPRARLAARRWKRSTRPPVSTSFCLPV